MGVPIVSGVAKKVFGTRNERLVKRYLRIVDEVSSHEAAMRRLTDSELRSKTQEFKDRVSDGADVNAMIPEIFAAAREGMDRSVGIRNIFDPAGAWTIWLLLGIAIGGALFSYGRNFEDGLRGQRRAREKTAAALVAVADFELLEHRRVALHS